MFSTNDILTLAKAGFTAQQIGALNNVATQPAQQTQPVVQQTQQTQPVVQQTQQTDMLSQIMAQLQTNAINATQQPQQQTTDDILASIINPNE